MNGRRLGASNDPRSAVFSLKEYLHPGENSVAVVMRTYGATGGLAQGVALRFVQPPAPVAWSRSVFNGLAQVIVQSTRGTPGPITLTAQSAELRPATREIDAQAALLPPAVP